MVEIDAAQIAGGYISSQVADHAAAEGEQCAVAVGRLSCEEAERLAEELDRLGLLAGWEAEDLFGSEARFRQHVGLCFQHFSIAEHADTASGRAQGGDVVFQRAEAVTEMNRVSALGELDGECFSLHQ